MGDIQLELDVKMTIAMLINASPFKILSIFNDVAVDFISRNVATCRVSVIENPVVVGFRERIPTISMKERIVRVSSY